MGAIEGCGRRIVLTTFGSLGDLHPFIAIALGLRERGHDVVIATHHSFRAIIEAEGIGFHAVRPDTTDFGDEAAVLRRAMDLRTGPEYVIRRMYLPHLRASYEDLTAAVRGADLLVTHTVTFAGPLVAERQDVAWASTTLAPVSLLSVYDPPVLASTPGLSRLHSLGPSVHRLVFRILRRHIRTWTLPVHRMRREAGLPPTSLDPMFEGQHSSRLNLALFSPVLAAPQPDWPPSTVLTGFPFYDRRGEAGNLDPDINAFLKGGEPPLIFTLGASVVREAGDFYRVSAEAARRLGRRALLLIGRDPRNRPATLPKGIAAFEYAPHSQVFKHAAAVIHQGGIGTTGQAMRAGRPQLVVPFFMDQPDNAARVTRLGVARTFSRKRYTPARVEAELRALLTDIRYSQRAAEVGRIVQAEDGVKTACDSLEALLSS